MDLFEYMRQQNMKDESPLASRLRPTTLDEVVGQQHIVGKDKLLYRAIKADKLSSIIFYGPPGTGKTTLAKVIANTTSAEFMQINTDSGIYGWGEAGLAYGKSAEAAFGQCQDFGKLIIGMDPFNTEEIWEHLHRHTFWGMGGGVVITSAMAAIDIACWDIKGKALGVPVYKLLGGKTNPKLRAYASQLQFGWSDLIQVKNKGAGLGLLFDPKDYYEVTKNAVRDGYDAIKVDPVFAATDPNTPLEKIWGSQGTQIRGCYRQHDLQRSVERIAACREAGGPDLDIIVEIHSLLDANTSAELGKALEPYRIMYYEEPTMPCNADMFKHIKEKSGLPLATGERSYTRWGFRQFFEDRTLSVIGALHYETQVAQAAAEQVGMKSLSAAEMTPQGFATIALLMSLCIIWGIVLSIFFNKRYTRKLSSGSGSGTGAAGFGDLAMTAMFIGLVSAYIGSYLGGFISSNGRFTFSGDWTPLLVAAVSAGVMALFVYLAEKKHITWVENFSIAGSMLAGMAAAVLVGLI